MSRYRERDREIEREIEIRPVDYTVIAILLFCLPTDSTRELENQQNYQCLDLNITDQKNPYSYLLIKQYVTS